MPLICIICGMSARAGLATFLTTGTACHRLSWQLSFLLIGFGRLPCLSAILHNTHHTIVVTRADWIRSRVLCTCLLEHCATLACFCGAVRRATKPARVRGAPSRAAVRGAQPLPLMGKAGVARAQALHWTSLNRQARRGMLFGGFRARATA